MNFRLAGPADVAVISDLAVGSGLFSPDDVQVVRTLLADYFAGLDARGHRCVVMDADKTAIGVAYYQPAPATDRAWYLTMIGMDRPRQGEGHGTALLRHVEDDLRDGGQRLLLVETSGRPDFARTRRFYERCGYTAVATVPDYYEPEDDLVLFLQRLATAR